jgi:hypothetical protein
VNWICSITARLHDEAKASQFTLMVSNTKAAANETDCPKIELRATALALK